MFLRRNSKALLLIVSRYIWRHKGLWLRAFLCFLIGLAFLLADRDHDYDLRLFIRGAQITDSNIVLINIEREDWQNLMNTKASMGPIKEAAYFTDGYFWHAPTWKKILEMTLGMNPKVIGVTPYFGSNITKPDAEVLQSYPFQDRRIVWSTMLDRDGRILPSRFAKSFSRTAGIADLPADRDGIIRRFGSQNLPTPPFAIQLARFDKNYTDYNIENLFQKQELINFRGRHNTFTHISVRELLGGQLPPDFLKNKTVIIGTYDKGANEYLTPVGKLSRAELTANILDNIKNKRWISRPPIAVSMLLILIFVISTAIITSLYPQFFALFILFWKNLIYITFSFWFFDVHYFWLPVSTIATVSAVTYFTFLSFQLTMKEYMNLQLEKERQFMVSVETLKNNFISLISHDLKTPIAKIQAICDRLLRESFDARFTGDIQMLKDVAGELHRYIQTILQVAKVESREFRLSLDSADINELTEIVVEQLKPLADAKNIQIEMDLEPMFLVEVDVVLIREVILNIIENAIKYSPTGGIIKVSTREVDDQLFLMVEDQGPGVPQNEQTRIFEKFYRGESGKAQQKGSGLGLYLVKYFIERHNGKVFFESTLGKGTRAGFSLPISEETATNEEPVSLSQNDMTGETNEKPV